MFTKLGDRIIMLLATGFGLGAAPRAPGTLGSLWGPPLVWTMQSAGLRGWTWAAAATAMAIIGVAICGRAASLIGKKDPGSVVYDEIVAFPIVFALTDVTWATAVLGFGFFRFFDIWKPWPVRQFERLPGGWGIMADDLIAGAYAAGVLAAVNYWLL